jgi:hypothetical protein
MNLPSISIHTIIKAVHSQNTTVYLTESLLHRKTTMTVVAHESGNIKTATTVHADIGDKVILRETEIAKLPLLLLVREGNTMKTIKNQAVYPNHKDMKKNLRFVTIAFFIMSLFISLLNIQSFSILPSWLNISFIILLICSIALFGYGLFLSKNFESWIKGGRNIFYFLLVISIQLLLTSNGMYMIGVIEGQIIEEVAYSQLTLLLYLASAVILLILSLFISSPKLRRVNSRKAFVVGSLFAVGIIALMFAALTIIREATFIHPESVKESYDFFMGSVLALFPATVLGMSLKRVRKGGMN